MEIRENHEQNSLDKLQQAIAEGPNSTQAEFDRVEHIQNWLVCFGSNLILLDFYLNLCKEGLLLSNEKLQAAEAKLEDLKKKQAQYMQEFPKRTDVIPDPIKEELLGSLNILE